jgi:hypothetical protein
MEQMNFTVFAVVYLSPPQPPTLSQSKEKRVPALQREERISKREVRTIIALFVEVERGWTPQRRL